MDFDLGPPHREETFVLRAEDELFDGRGDPGTRMESSMSLVMLQPFSSGGPLADELQDQNFVTTPASVAYEASSSATGAGRSVLLGSLSRRGSTRPPPWGISSNNNNNGASIGRGIGASQWDPTAPPLPPAALVGNASFASSEATAVSAWVPGDRRSSTTTTTRMPLPAPPLAVVGESQQQQQQQQQLALHTSSSNGPPRRASVSFSRFRSPSVVPTSALHSMSRRRSSGAMTVTPPLLDLDASTAYESLSERPSHYGFSGGGGGGHGHDLNTPTTATATPHRQGVPASSSERHLLLPRQSQLQLQHYQSNHAFLSPSGVSSAAVASVFGDRSQRRNQTLSSSVETLLAASTTSSHLGGGGDYHHHHTSPSKYPPQSLQHNPPRGASPAHGGATFAVADATVRSPLLAFPALPPSLYRSPTGPSATDEDIMDEGSTSESAAPSPHAHSIGRGRFGRVAAVHSPDFSSTVAVKTVDGGAEPESAAAELDFAARAFAVADVEPRVWTNVVEVFEAEHDGYDRCAAVAMEFLPGGTLADHAAFRIPRRTVSGSPQQPACEAQSRSERQAVEVRLRRLAKDLCFGLHTFERALRVIHRDLKPRNVLFTADGTAKLADFGVSAVLDDDVDVATDFKGSVMYMSPERLRGEVHGCNSDVWSLGVVLLQMANGGEHPFEPDVWMGGEGADGGGDAFWRLAAVIRHTDSAAECARATAAAVEVALARAGLSDLFCDFVRHCLVTSGAERVGATQLMLHDWLSDN